MERKYIVLYDGSYEIGYDEEFIHLRAGEEIIEKERGIFYDAYGNHLGRVKIDSYIVPSNELAPGGEKRTLLIVEGARNVGKTYLTENLYLPKYKLPFASYFKQFLDTGDFKTNTQSKEAHQFTLGYDVTVLGLPKVMQMDPLLLDRGFLSNVVFGVMQKRITADEGVKYVQYLAEEGLLDDVAVIYVTGNRATDDRNKDDWAFLDKDNAHRLYQYFMNVAKRAAPNLVIVEFENRFDGKSEAAFHELFWPYRN